MVFLLLAVLAFLILSTRVFRPRLLIAVVRVCSSYAMIGFVVVTIYSDDFDDFAVLLNLFGTDASTSWMLFSLGVFNLSLPSIVPRLFCMEPSSGPERVTRFTARDRYSHFGQGMCGVFFTGLAQICLILAYGAGLSQDLVANLTLSVQQLLALYLGYLVLAALYIRHDMIDTLLNSDILHHISFCFKDGSREIVVRQVSGRGTNGQPVSTPVQIHVSRYNFKARNLFWLLSNGLGTRIILFTVPIVMVAADTFTEAVFNAAAVRAPAAGRPGRAPRSFAAPLVHTCYCLLSPPCCAVC
jgi:hypothetical protein